MNCNHGFHSTLSGTWLSRGSNRRGVHTRTKAKAALTCESRQGVQGPGQSWSESRWPRPLAGGDIPLNVSTAGNKALWLGGEVIKKAYWVESMTATKHFSSKCFHELWPPSLGQGSLLAILSVSKNRRGKTREGLASVSSEPSKLLSYWFLKAWFPWSQAFHSGCFEMYAAGVGGRIVAAG